MVAGCWVAARMTAAPNMTSTSSKTSWQLQVVKAVPFAATLALAETVTSGMALALRVPLLGWLACHVAIVGLAVAFLWRHRAGISDTSPQSVTLIATLAAGPVGAVLSALATTIMPRELAHPELLNAWYDRIALSGDIDDVTSLYNTVAMGRGMLTPTTLPPVYEQVMRDGSLEDRQAALGLIARHFSPKYAPVLRLALISPEPVIRVQAAAVAVKVRAELKTSLAVVLEQAARSDLSPSQIVECALLLDDIVRSGLLEDEDRDFGSATLQKLLATASSDRVPVTSADDEPAAATQALLETQLLRQGDFAAFRAVRAQVAKCLPGTTKTGAHG